MKIIAVMNQKGGIGKTMTASSVAYILADGYKKRVLIADADQQGNISMLFGRYEPEGVGMSELLEGRITPAEAIQKTGYDRIDIITANGYLMQTNMKLLLQERDNQVTRFKDAMNAVRGRYDYCVVDCGLILDMDVTNVLVAADLVVIPVKIGGFEIEAMENMTGQLEDLRALNPGVKSKILLTMLQGNKTSRQVDEWLYNTFGDACFWNRVRRSIIAEKATMERVPLPRFSPRSKIAEDYKGVTHEIILELEG